MSIEKLYELENKLKEMRTNIQKESLWIMRNIYSGSQNELTERKNNLENLKLEYGTVENEYNKRTIAHKEELDKIRDLELFAEQQKKLEEIRLQNLENEKKQLNDVISKCKLLANNSIPKFEELVQLTKENIQILKEKQRTCLLEHNAECPINMEQKLKTDTEIYGTKKDQLISFHVDYEAEECPGDSCKPLETNYEKLDYAHSRKNKGLNYAKKTHQQCLQSNNDKCNLLLEQLIDSQKKMNAKINMVPNLTENFSTLGDIKNNNTKLKQMQTENLKYNNQTYFLKNMSKDNQYLQNSELNTNILLATLGSVLLYYLFFEI
jgi:hypothetical protein